MKEIARLETLTKDFQRELDQVNYSIYSDNKINGVFQLRHTIRDRSDALQSKDRELATLRKKEQSFHSTVESLQSKLDGEASKNRDADGQVK